MAEKRSPTPNSPSTSSPTPSLTNATPPEPSQLAAWIQDQLAEPVPVALVGLSAVSGGCIHRAWRVELADGRRLFLKSNGLQALPLLRAEAEGLQALAVWCAPPLVVPQPLGMGVLDGRALLLLPWLELAPNGSGAPPRRAADWQALGEALAALHRASGDGHALAARSGSYGWPNDNFIGATPQGNGWCSAWGPFFVGRRLRPQLEWLARSGNPLRGAEALIDQAGQWLAHHHPQPVLVHGDLWGGNAALLADGACTVFDPAVYWGDREVDLAMARLFGGFPAAFFQGYANRWPLDPGAQGRMGLYNLYHLLNHANLFGGSYLGQAQRSIDQLLNNG